MINKKEKALLTCGDRGQKLNPETTGCPRVQSNFDSPLFLDICRRSRLSFHMVNGHSCGFDFKKKILTFFFKTSNPQLCLFSTWKDSQLYEHMSEKRGESKLLWTRGHPVVWNLSSKREFIWKMDAISSQASGTPRACQRRKDWKTKTIPYRGRDQYY